MFLALSWVATLGLLLSGEQPEGGEISVFTELLRDVADLKQNNKDAIEAPPPTLSSDPPKYSCLRDTPLKIDIPDGSWNEDGFQLAEYRFNGDTYRLESKWTEDDELISTDVWRKRIVFMLVGCPKCGTTSLYEYLVQHPLLSRPRLKETQCFFENWDENDPNCLEWYDTDRLFWEPSIISGDFTPEYLFRTELVIPRVKHAFPWAKIVAIFRDPIERGYSEHRMKVANNKTLDTFEARVASDLMALKKAGLLPHWRLSPDAPDEESEVEFDHWKDATLDMDAFDKFHGTQDEVDAWVRYQSDVGNGVVGRGLYRVELTRWMMTFPCERFLIFRMEDFSAEDGVEMTMERLHHHLDLTYIPLRDQEARNTRHTESDIIPDTRSFLQKFFKPYNDRLYEILGDEWKHPWEYDI